MSTTAPRRYRNPPQHLGWGAAMSTNTPKRTASRRSTSIEESR
ncbi:hypothetical protein AB0F52_34145 [Amycolatopsis sp. NPDC024027]